jgi:hypothetical protein
LAQEAHVTLVWFPGDRSARLLRVSTPGGKLLDVDKLVKSFDLTLLRSGTSFPVEDLVDVARWGHFTNSELPWEQIKPI